MAQYIKQGNIFGRIGSNIGKGLAEQIPEEVKRNRLNSGLQDLEKDSGNLNQQQYFTRALQVPHLIEHPQAIQSLAELAKVQNQGNAYSRAAGKNQPNANNISRNNSDVSQIQQNISDENAPTQQSSDIGKSSIKGDEKNNQRSPNIERNQDIPQVVSGNPLNQQNLPKTPWSPQQRNQQISDYIEQGFLPDQAKQLASDDEARDLGQPEVHKERQENIKSAKKEVRETLKRHLETKLQKSGDNLYKDVEGPMIVNAERGMIRDLILNPNADIDNVANDWSERLYRTAIAKDKMKTLGKTTGVENFLKGNQSVKKLQEYQDIFKRSGNLEEFKNLLKGPDFGMSEQAASSISYPTSKNISEYISKMKPNHTAENSDQKARKAALEIEKLGVGTDDSISSIAKSLSDKDPYFDQQAFFDQISEDKDKIGLNERQRLELAEGVRNILPNWADLLYLPIFRRS